MILPVTSVYVSITALWYGVLSLNVGLTRASTGEFYGSKGSNMIYKVRSQGRD